MFHLEIMLYSKLTLAYSQLVETPNLTFRYLITREVLKRKNILITICYFVRTSLFVLILFSDKIKKLEFYNVKRNTKPS